MSILIAVIEPRDNLIFDLFSNHPNLVTPPNSSPTRKVLGDPLGCKGVWKKKAALIFSTGNFSLLRICSLKHVRNSYSFLVCFDSNTFYCVICNISTEVYLAPLFKFTGQTSSKEQTSFWSEKCCATTVEEVWRISGATRVWPMKTQISVRWLDRAPVRATNEEW